MKGEARSTAAVPLSGAAVLTCVAATPLSSINCLLMLFYSFPSLIFLVPFTSVGHRPCVDTTYALSWAALEQGTDSQSPGLGRQWAARVPVPWVAPA